MSLFEEIGGRKTLERVHRIFYNKVYIHPWLKKFFFNKDQVHLETQQSDFMSTAMGGPRAFQGRLPKSAHEHMLITEELFEIRHRLLKDSIREFGLAEELMEKWLRIDASFKNVICKKDISECKKRYKSDKILAFTQD